MALHHTVLSHESQEAFDAIFENIAAEFEPATDSEEFLALTMAQARWRLARLRRAETAALESILNPMDAQPDPADPHVYLAAALTDGAKDKFSAIQRYIQIAERCYYKARKELLDAQKARAKSKSTPRPAVQPQSPYPDPTDPDVPLEDIDPEIAADLAFFESIIAPPTNRRSPASEFHYAATAGAGAAHATAKANDSPTL